MRWYQYAICVGACLKKLANLYPDGKMKRLPSTEKLVLHAIGWANKAGFVVTPNPPPRQTIDQIDTQVQNEVRTDHPQRQAAIAAVCAAVQATQGARCCSQADADVERAAECTILQTQEHEAIDAATETALEAATNA